MLLYGFGFLIFFEGCITHEEKAETQMDRYQDGGALITSYSSEVYIRNLHDGFDER